jgi:hypothetical protein
MNYTTVEALRNFGGFEDEEEDDMLDALIASASSVIDNYCNRIFAADEETTRVFTRTTRREDPFDGQLLYFDDDLAEEASAITDSPTVVYIPENIPPYFAMELTEGSWNATAVSITGYWAYSKTPPADIEYACLRLSKWLYELRDTTRADAVIVTPEGRLLVPQGLPVEVQTILRPYQRYGTGT